MRKKDAKIIQTKEMGLHHFSIFFAKNKELKKRHRW